jgi:hypothetical protein
MTEPKPKTYIVSLGRRRWIGEFCQVTRYRRNAWKYKSELAAGLALATARQGEAFKGARIIAVAAPVSVAEAWE